MQTLRLRMSRAQFMERLRELPGTLAGTIPDRFGIVEPVIMAGALAMLTRLDQHVQKLTHGGIGDDGTQLEPLKAPTLVLRRKNTSKAALGRLVAEVRKQGASRRRLFLTQLKRARTVFSDKKQRRVALGILRKMKPTIPEKRYSELLKLLSTKPPKLSRRPKNTSPQNNERYDRLDAIKMRRYERKLNVVAFAAAGALILIDTARMVGAFSPSYTGPDQKREIRPGSFELDNNVEYFKYHQSDQPRQAGPDGKPKLPRRNLIPDIIPAEWVKDARDAMVEALGKVGTLKQFFEGAA